MANFLNIWKFKLIENLIWKNLSILNIIEYIILCIINVLFLEIN